MAYNLVANPACELGGKALRATEVTDPFEHTLLYRPPDSNIATDPMPG
jgi:hypothetical protein